MHLNGRDPLSTLGLKETEHFIYNVATVVTAHIYPRNLCTGFQIKPHRNRETREIRIANSSEKKSEIRLLYNIPKWIRVKVYAKTLQQNTKRY